MPACIHYPSRKGLHEANFRGIIGAVTQIIYTVSGVGTVSFMIDPSGYAANFDGVVQILEDLNITISGISTGGGPSGVSYTAGSGLYLVNGTEFNINYNNVFQNSVSGHILGTGSNTVVYSGNAVLVSGTSISPTQSFIAGANLIQGAVVYVSGTQVFEASAVSGIAAFNYGAIGITAASAGVTSGIAVNLDNVVVVSANNITAESSLTPGEYYYLSKYAGQLTRYTTASGSITASGTDQYQALVGLGKAVSTTQIEIEVSPPILLN